MIKLLNNYFKFFLNDVNLCYSIDEIYDHLYNALSKHGYSDPWLVEDLIISIEGNLGTISQSQGFLTERDFLEVLTDILRFNGLESVLEYFYSKNIFFRSNSYNQSQIFLIKNHFQINNENAFKFYQHINFRLKSLGYNKPVQDSFFIKLAEEEIKQSKFVLEKRLKVQEKLFDEFVLSDFAKVSFTKNLFTYLCLNFDFIKFCNLFKDYLMIIVFEKKLLDFFQSNFFPYLKKELKAKNCDYVRFNFFINSYLEKKMGNNFYKDVLKDIEGLLSEKFPPFSYKINIINKEEKS